MLHWTIEKKILELKYTWKIARNSSDEKVNFIVSVSDGKFKGQGEVAPNIRYSETIETVEKLFDLFIKSKPEEIQNEHQLAELLESSGITGALRFGIESALIHYICDKKSKSVAEQFSLKAIDTFPISFSIPIMEIGRIKEFYKENKLDRFPFIKIKVNTEEPFETIKHISSFCDCPLMIDANEAFTDVEQCIYFLEKIKKLKVEFVEQPLPANADDQSVYLKKYSPLPLFADESVIAEADFSHLKEIFDGVNVKLMKAGGYINAIRLLKEAQAQKMKTMIGCMVETTLGISSGLNLCSLTDYADLDSFLAVKNEPFGLVKENGGILHRTTL